MSHCRNGWTRCHGAGACMCGCKTCNADRTKVEDERKRNALLGLIAAENAYLIANGWTYDESPNAGDKRWSKSRGDRARGWRNVDRTHAVNAQKQLDAASRNFARRFGSLD